MIVSQATLKRREAQYSGVGGYLKVGGNWGWKLQGPKGRSLRPEGPKAGVEFLGREQPAPPHFSLDRGPGERCELPSGGILEHFGTSEIMPERSEG